MSEKPERKLPTGDALRRRIWSGGRSEKDCSHHDQIRQVKPQSEGCEACLAMGDSWVHLRLCLSCGYVGCCNDSKNKHAARHSQASHHPIVQSFEPGEDWKWCYVDQVMLD